MKENQLTSQLRDIFYRLSDNPTPTIPIYSPIVFEAKIVKNNAQSFRFAQENPSRRQTFEKQIETLQDIKSRGLFYKPSDAIGLEYTLSKPCDALWLPSPRAYIVIFFYIPRIRKTACFIDVDRYVEYEDSAWKRKKGSKTSANYEEIKTLSDFTINMLGAIPAPKKRRKLDDEWVREIDNYIASRV